MAHSARQFVAAPILAIAMLGVLLFGVVFWRDGSALLSEGRPLVADVVSVSRGKGTTIAFRWTVSGETFEASDGGSGAFRDYSGDKIDIVYWPAHPSVAHFDPAGLERRGKMMIAVGVPFFALLSWVMWRNIRRHR